MNTIATKQEQIIYAAMSATTAMQLNVLQMQCLLLADKQERDEAIAAINDRFAQLNAAGASFKPRWN